ncbi:patatin-like phospholipase family protein [Agarivorans aestuarii]|uniref:patatin-like phospholipase family protein n=1 Tax=Agarivorans aestuarii TaxID=1563703 RepID=UPI001C7E8F22|nr:patatin-like phospholipase family protein [Agarivorans aestuarii]
MTRSLLLAGMSLLLIACSSPPERNALPLNKLELSGILADHNIRTWGDVDPDIDNLHAYNESFDNQLLVDEQGNFRIQNILTISGGGANGAYGAGLLNGMSDSGQRPEYRLVTGISTGAILGLYAFLGSDYDYKIRRFYTEYSDDNIYNKRSLFRLFSSSSLLDTQPFIQLVRDEINQELMAQVAAEHLRGRRFLVKTTNLDAQRAVIWDMGAIAQYKGEEAELLFESVIIASAAIPGVFEPVLLPVMVDGEVYDELHVDGGVMAQVFFIPENLDISVYRRYESQYLESLGVGSGHNLKSRVWVVSNSKLASEWQETDPGLFGIMGRSIATMLRFQTQTNVSLIERQAKLTNSELKLSYIHHTVPGFPVDAPFDNTYMRWLYCYGYSQGINPQHWETHAPNYAALYEQQIAEAEQQQLAIDITSFDWEHLEPGLSLKIEQCLSTL